MADAEPQPRAPYEQALRVIGRFLDAEPSYHLSVIEVADGFTVRSHSSRFKSDGRDVEFTWERLNDLLIYHTAGRGLRRRHHRHRGIWDEFPNGHEDFFRALGFNLDHESAGSLAVDEVPDGITVSYQRPSAPGSSHVETVRTVMQKEEIQRLLEDAQSRRVASQPQSGSSVFAGSPEA